MPIFEHSINSPWLTLFHKHDIALNYFYFFRVLISFANSCFRCRIAAWALHTLAETSEIETRAPAPRRRECTRRAASYRPTDSERTPNYHPAFSNQQHTYTLLQLRKSQFWHRGNDRIRSFYRKTCKAIVPAHKFTDTLGGAHDQQHWLQRLARKRALRKLWLMQLHRSNLIGKVAV